VAVSTGEVSAARLDSVGLTRARQLAMAAAIKGIALDVEYLLVDAYDIPDLPLPQLAVYKGDAMCASIMAASIVAKVYRDGMMVGYDELYPGYGFAEHKGYATAAHRRALVSLGPSPIHRMSWAPLRALVASELRAVP
jgi:ribonuclease HII